MDSACPDGAFADRAGRKYPCHTKSAAFQSALIAADAGESSPMIVESLAKFASFWGIDAEVADATAAIALTKQSASPDELSDEDYALVAEHDGQKIRKFAAYDVSSTVAAAEAFYDQRIQFPFTWRKTAAEKLLAFSAKHGAYLPTYVNEYLLKAACVARPTEDSVDAGLVHRLNLSHKRDDDVMSKLSSVLNKVATAPRDFDRSAIAEVLEVVDSVDREIKLAFHYDSGRCPLPEEMLVVAKRSKTASTPVRLIDGSMIDASSLTKEALATVDEGLATMSLAKLAEVLPTLPLPDVRLLRRMLPKNAADMGALTDDNFSAQTAPGAMAPAPVAAPSAAPMAPAAPASGMVDPAAGAAASKMAPIASGMASSNFAGNGGNLPSTASEQVAMNQASDQGAGASLGIAHSPLR